MEPPSPCAVVIVSHERPDRLRALLRSLSQHAHAILAEVVVVDDSKQLSVRREEFPQLDLRIVHLENRVFVSEARNRGLARVQSEFVYVVDDDNVADPTTVAHPLGVLARDPQIGALMPSVMYLTRPNLVWVYATPFRPDRWHFDLIGRNRPRNPALEGRLLPTDALPNAAVFRRDVLQSLGGYDARRFPVSSTADLCRRLKLAGHTVWADTGAVTYHDVELPDTLHYGASHATDPQRIYYDKRDWFEFQRGIRVGESAFAVRALWHSSRGLAASFLGFVLRPEARILPLTYQMARGVRDGLRPTV
jgi:GT2 family glycosyltransferase